MCLFYTLFMNCFLLVKLNLDIFVIGGFDTAHAAARYDIVVYVARTFQNCRWVHVGFSKSGVFFEIRHECDIESEESA